jgi:hypothetical protein
MSKLARRDFNIMDGGYVNLPDYHTNTQKYIGLKDYNSSVLVHNWSEERTKPEKLDYSSNTTYKLDYKGSPDARPDVVIRRKLTKGSEGIGARNLLSMHDTDPKKNLITMYDEIFNKRRPQSDNDLRKWNILNDRWLPEKIDHPIQDTPTNWGFTERKKNEIEFENDVYKNQVPQVSEYKSRFQAHSAHAYNQQKTLGVPKDYSTSLYVINTALNNTTQARTTSTQARQPQTRDVLDIAYDKLYTRPRHLPRTLYYLGKVPTDGSAGIYRIRDFETLMPPTSYDQQAKENITFNNDTSSSENNTNTNETSSN